AEVSADADVIGRSSDGLPLIWTVSRGKGQVLYANTSMFQDKVNRGLLLQLINYNADISRSTMINAAIFNIDDFPAPIPLGKNPKIFEDYQRDTIKFYKEIWWSDVRLLLEKYNLKPSGFIIGIYNNETEAPFNEIFDQDRKTISYFGRKLSEAGGVMGIHGYNHNPLALEGEIRFEDYGYSPWSSKEDMTASLEYLKQTIHELFGDVNPKSYVAPSNLISKTGMEAVVEAFPEIEVFAGLYTSPSEPGLFLQEFGPNPEFEQIYNTPRISSGYINSKETMWNIFNGIAEFGIFNHYIHPDDLLDPNRSKGMNWQNMKIDFEKMLRSTFRKFPFLRGYNNYEAYLRFKQYDKMQVDTWREVSARGGTTYTIAHRNAVMPVFHYFRTSRDITSITGGKLNPLPREGLYVIEATEALVEIELK
ncbi:MAG: DUF2194 domain-containing protein, partial [Spirochaetales bacterium]|nr:DUF2194 domain-containing protein [Spirochaetales bacterium]